MRKIVKTGLGLLLLAATAAIPAAQKVKTVDGVEYVMNGKKPNKIKGLPTKVTLEEEMTAGGGDDPDQSLAEVGFFQVIEDGTIYALDVKDRKVKVFDKDGKFLFSIGKPGQGPGEIGIPSNLQITTANELMLEDAANRRLSYFSLDGEFLRNQNMADKGLGLTTLIPDGKGNYAGRQMGVEGQELYFELKKFDKDLNPLFTVSKMQFQIPVPGSGVKINIMDFITVYAFDSQGLLYYGPNTEYEIQVYGPQGKHVKSIQREYDPVKVEQEDIDQIMDRMSAFSGLGGGANITDLIEFPDYFPPYQAFLLDDQDRMYVRTWNKGEDKGAYWVDVFDQQGRFFTRFPTKLELQIIEGDKAYGVEENEDGFRVIKRYRMTWSD
jgi:hypothetical protein